MQGDASLARLFRDFGQRWDIEQIPPGTKWVAVLRESGGDLVVMVAAHEVGTLRFRMSQAEGGEPAGSEPGART
jgi:hypothetical protein